MLLGRPLRYDESSIFGYGEALGRGYLEKRIQTQHETETKTICGTTDLRMHANPSELPQESPQQHAV